MKLTNPCRVEGIGVKNKDGYFRIWTGDRATRKQVMRHRAAWEIDKGPIPKGYEINHICKNRGCYNIDHLECLPKSQHATLSNKERYEKVRVSGLELLSAGVGKKEVAKRLGRTVHTINRWLREK